MGVDAPEDPIKLTQIARDVLREKFLKADLGISGANFMVAETGTLVLVTNEGNGRMCTTLPDVHIAIAGIDKIIPDWDALGVMFKLLARSATGQKLSTYTSFITGPKKSDAEHGPKELHLVILDNGRSNILRTKLDETFWKCIRWRLLSECLSCVSKCGWLCLRLVHLRSYRGDFYASNPGNKGCRTAAICLNPVRGVCGRVPGQGAIH